MTTIHLVHGFNVTDGGASTVARLGPLFAQHAFEPKVFSYGWVGLLGAWFLNPRIVRQFMARVNPGDIGVGHSNGCVILHMAAVHGAQFSSLFYLNPALTSACPRLPSNLVLDVYYANDDVPVRMAAWLRALAPWAPLGDPLWGDMGARGYQETMYADGQRSCQGFMYNHLDKISMALSRYRLVRFVLQVLVGFPLAIIYLLLLAPLEVAFTLYINNVRSGNLEAFIRIHRPEDRGFLFYGALLPVTIIGLMALLLIIY